MRATWGMLVIALTSCGDDSSEDTLTCEYLTGSGNCFRSALYEMYACMGLEERADPESPDGVTKFYIEGNFVSNSECVDSGGKRIVFDPPIDFTNLPGIVYDSSFTMYKGATTCGTVVRDTSKNEMTLSTPGMGSILYEQSPTQQALTCPDGVRMTGDLAAQMCYAARPHFNGVHLDGLAALRLFPTEPTQPIPEGQKAFTFRCTIPTTVTGGKPVTLVGRQ